MIRLDVFPLKVFVLSLFAKTDFVRKGDYTKTKNTIKSTELFILSNPFSGGAIPEYRKTRQ